MIKGTTKIELYNPATKIKTVKRSENTFQSSVIAEGLRNLGAANASLLNTNATRAEAPWKKTVGGILLFEQNITPGDYFASAGNKMIGNGAVDVVNAGTPTELGSFNSVASSATANSISMVYEYNTSQANGTIRSICLTSQMGGLMGYGNPSGVGKANPHIFEENQEILLLNTLDNAESSHRAICGNYSYLFTLSGTNLLVDKTHVAITEGSVFDNLAKQITIDVSTLSHSYVVDNGFHIAGAAGGKIYICPVSPAPLTNGSVYKYWEFNPADDTISEKTFTSTNAGTLLPQNVSFANGCLFMKISGTNKMAVYNMSTGVYIREIEDADNVYFDIYNMRVGELPNGLVLVPYNTASANYLSIYDSTNDTVYITNAKKNDNYYYTNYTYDSTTKAMQWAQKNGVLACNNPLYLATINNLTGDDVVTKTSAQTMKITYTLTAV